MVLKNDGITGELQAFSCFEKPSWLQNQQDTGVPWRDNQNLRNIGNGTRQHAFKSVWEQTLDPLGKSKLSKSKSSKPETWSIDWKSWPPRVPPFPKGLKIPVTAIPQIDLRLSFSGRWHEITHGTTIVPVNFANKKYFDKLGGYLNQAQCLSFHVTPPSLLFLHAKAGQFYSVKVVVFNSGTQPRRLRVLPPTNSCFTVVRAIDPKDAISPGCSITLTVEYRPKSNISLNDVMILHVDGDGAIIVPLVSACTPDPILELEEWNCGCSTVGIPRTSHFEVKNLGGEGRFWIITEDEFLNQYLECHLKYKRDVIVESTKALLRRHTQEVILEPEKPMSIVGRAETMGLIQHKKDSLDEEERAVVPSGGAKKKGAKKVKPTIYTNCFRINPSCFRLQRNQSIQIKVRYHPKDANFHYEKLAILCENGEVRWIAVKGLGIDRDSDKLVEIKAPWTGPPVDLPTDPRTKFVLDCGDLISGELGILQFSIVNKSCIPLYFFWSVRPVLTNPEDSPENVETRLMERFYESTLYDQDGHTFFMEEENEQNDLESFLTSFPLTISPAQGLLEKKEDLQMQFTAVCPMTLGYHTCVISLFVEQVDEESRHAVVETLKELDKSKFRVPISQAEINKEAASTPTEGSVDEDLEEEEGEGDNFAQIMTTPSTAEFAYSEAATDVTNSTVVEEEAEDEDENEEYKPLRKSLDEYTTNIAGQGKMAIKTETILPAVIAKRVSDSKLSETKKRAEAAKKTDFVTLKRHSQDPQAIGSTLSIEDVQLEGFITDLEEEGDNRRGSPGIGLTESVNVRYLTEAASTEHDRSMNQGHGVYEDLNLYTENVVPTYKLWPNRDKMLTPVAEVEVWLNSVPLDVTFTPPFIIATGLVKTSVQRPSGTCRMITIQNGSKHTIDVNFENLTDSPIPITCHPGSFSVKPKQKFTFKLVIYFEKCGQIQKFLKGTLTLPFTTVPCSISAILRAYGPFLEVLTPTLNFGIVPLSSETMKTLALKNTGDRPMKWVARITPDGMEDENKRELSGHQARIHDKRLVRIWPDWGILNPGESAGLQVYFCAELSGEVASYVEVMAEGNPDSVVSVPVYGEIELPYLVLERGLVQFNAENFVQQPVQNGTCTIINPSGFNVAFMWQCPVGRQSKLCTVQIHPKQGVVPSKGRIEFAISVESLLKDIPLDITNLFVSCCVDGMREPLILKIETE